MSASQAPAVDEAQVIDALHTVYDPEIPIDIYDLGLIYAVNIDDGRVLVEMTLTSPACPVAQSLPEDVQRAVLSVPGVRSVHVDLVWEPPWGPDRMSEAARLDLGFFT